MSSFVLGAAGFLGVNLVDALLARGEVPRCGRRARTNILTLKKKKVPLVQADLDAPEQLASAFAGVETVYHLAGHYPRYSHGKAAAIALGTKQLSNVFDAAVAAGVRRVVYVSSTATVAPATAAATAGALAGAPADAVAPSAERPAPGRASTEADVFPAPPGFGTYHDLKWAMEAAALAESRLEVLVACPSACLGPWDLRVGTSALVVATAHGLDPAHPDGVVSWVDARDVAEGLVRLAAAPRPPRRVLLSAGSTRLQALLERLSSRYGVPVPCPPLSDADALALADAEEAKALAGGDRPRLSREIADLIIHGVPIDAALSREALALRYRPLDETLDAFDAWARRLRLIPSPAALESTA